MPTLNLRQIQEYKDLIDIYAQVMPSAGTLKEATDKVFPATPTQTNVPCAFHPTDEFDEPRTQGRTKQTNIMTADKFFVTFDTEIKDGNLIRLKTPGHEDYGAFWVVEGNPKDRASYGMRRANYRKVLARRTPIPSGVTP